MIIRFSKSKLGNNYGSSVQKHPSGNRKMTSDFVVKNHGITMENTVIASSDKNLPFCF